MNNEFENSENKINTNSNEKDVNDSSEKSFNEVIENIREEQAYNQNSQQGVNYPYGQQTQQGFNNNQPYGQQTQQGFNNNGSYGQQFQQGFNSPYGQTPNSNPYENSPYSNNTATPNVQYLPYTPDTVLPPGIKPEFINGGWYYPVVSYSTFKTNKTPMATSIKVLLGIIISLTVIFIGIFVWWIASNNSKYSSNDGNNIFNFELPTENSTTKKSTDSIGKYADPNGPQIKLEKNNTENGSTEKAYEALSESVVSISVYDEDDDPAGSVPNSEGTGIVLSSNGYIVTNSHVINDTTDNSNVWITKKDGSAYPVVVVGCDVRTDIAVLKCEEADNWSAATFATSNELKVGQDVVAIGSPGGSSYSNSLTRGIISALNRTLSGSAVTYIQTDAAINPGNSGGPLANMNGQVIGINTIKVVDTQYEGMGFAIPSTKVKEVADQLIKNGYVPGRAKLGIMGKELSKSLANYYGTDAGIIINTIESDSPLRNTKIKEGDVITKIDDTPVTSFVELFSTLDKYSEGDTVKLTVCRYDKENTDNKETFTVDVTLAGDGE